ncbi:MAG: FlgD immunoglobulin-like domain containing protein [Candidatus Krumholzibacteria bacterium]|jgi:hypothetical protein|nr:FlgD immunoglobulin-like domain containing protein [Candidatus Krumholzibacteria bacterium]MDP7022406.1 FlgD immunoglobulin-like domain containing protein [Candidatus Krumholzibacteria bacterium]
MRGFPIRPVLCLLLLLFGTQGSLALLSFEFEQPFYLEEIGVQVKDHSVVYHEGLYHVFFIQSYLPEPGDWLRAEKWFGHITSPDLMHWTHHDPILEVIPETWESSYVWAPVIIDNPQGEGWFMYYTGVDSVVCQQTGLAYSQDLYEWTRHPDNPLYVPGEWSNWEVGPWANNRDPEIFFNDQSGYYYLLTTAMTSNGLGAVGSAFSTDAVNWSDQGPFFVNDTENLLESVQILRDEQDYYHLFFTEQNIYGTSHLYSEDLFVLGAWIKENATTFDSGNGPELTWANGELLFSRYNSVEMEDGPLYFLRFDAANLETGDHIPVVESKMGLSESWTEMEGFGEAFVNQPTFGDNPRERGMPTSFMQGNGYIATYERYPYPGYNTPGWIQGFAPTGMIRSESFEVSSDRMMIMVGGGELPDTCFVALVNKENHRLLFSETGENKHSMSRRFWNTSTQIGREVYLVIADLYAGDWGCISADSFEEYWYDGHEHFPPIDPMSNGPTLGEVVEAAGFSGTGVDEGIPAPRGELLPPWPNPFNPKVTLRFDLETEAQIDLRILDIRGREVCEILNERRRAGSHELSWNGRDTQGASLPSGVYLARLRANGQILSSRKLVMIR